MKTTKYIWQRKEWPEFTWDDSKILKPLGHVRKVQGRLFAKAAEIGLETQALILTEEAHKTSAIEGERLDLNSIRSSVASRLGLPTAGLPPPQRHIDGLIEMLLDACQNYSKPLTAKRLKGWQAGLFPTGYSGLQKITVGKWRTGSDPMQVISGPIGHEKVHFEAPPSKKLGDEMEKFLTWFNSRPKIDGLIKAAIAHFWFVTIHPFEDGNGRLARAITDMALAQDEERSIRFYSLSAQINKERPSYYKTLESCQKGDLNLTPWILWFLELFQSTLKSSEVILNKTLFIGEFWKTHAHIDLNSRQKKVLQKLLEAEPEGFLGGITNRKYVSLTKTSRETAKRDLGDLEEKGLIKRNESKGRSISYSLVQQLVPKD